MLHTPRLTSLALTIALVIGAPLAHAAEPAKPATVAPTTVTAQAPLPLEELRTFAEVMVIATLGNGSLSPAAREGALYCYEHHVVCVRASRILNGAVSPSEQDAQFHTLPAHQLHAVAARTLVALALAQQASRDELAYYLRYY